MLGEPSREFTVLGLLALVAVIAVDLAALRLALPMDFGPFHPRFVSQTPTFPNCGLVVMVLVLEVGLFRAASRSGRERVFWLGFEAGGWVYVIAGLAFAQPTWLLTRSIFEGCLLRRQMSGSSEMEGFVLFAFSLHLLAALAVAFVTGFFARSVGSSHPVVPPSCAARANPGWYDHS